MPLHEKQIEFIQSLITDYVDLTATDLETLQAKVTLLNIICKEATVIREGTNPVRAKRPSETLDQYQLFLMLANPCIQFLGLENLSQDTTFLISEAQITALHHINSLILSALKAYAKDSIPDTWITEKIWEKEAIETAFLQNKTNQEHFISHSSISDPFVANDYNWNLPRRGDMYVARIRQTEIKGDTKVQEQAEEKEITWIFPVLNLDIAVQFQREAPFIISFSDFIDYPIDDAAKAEVISNAVEKAEREAAMIILQRLGVEVYFFRPADKLLTYRYYFDAVNSKKISRKDFDHLSPEVLNKLRSPVVIALLANNICNITTAKLLPPSLIMLLQTNYYKDLVLQKIITLDSLYGLTTTQIKILGLPSIINLQIRNPTATFAFAINMSPDAAILLTNTDYFDRAVDNRIDIHALQDVTALQKDFLLEPSTMKILFDSPHLLKIVTDANYFYVCCKYPGWLNKIKTISEQQVSMLSLLNISYLISMNYLPLELALQVPEWQIQFISRYSLLIWEKIISLKQCLFIDEISAQEFNKHSDKITYLLKHSAFNYTGVNLLALAAWSIYFFKRLEDLNLPNQTDSIEQIKNDYRVICTERKIQEEADADKPTNSELLLSEIIRIYLKKIVYDADDKITTLDEILDIITCSTMSEIETTAKIRTEIWKNTFDEVVTQLDAPTSFPSDSYFIDINTNPIIASTTSIRFFADPAENPLISITLSLKNLSKFIEALKNAPVVESVRNVLTASM